MAFKHLLVSSVSAMALGLALTAPAVALPSACTGVISGSVSGSLVWSTGNCSISGSASNTTNLIAASGLLGTLTNSGSIIAGNSSFDTGILQSGGSIAEIYNNGGSISGDVGINAEGGLGTLLNSGTIASNSFGFLNGNIFGQGTVTDLENYGLIESAGIGIQNYAGTIEALDNHSTGSISSFLNNTNVLVGTLTNAGTIGGATGLAINNLYGATILSLVNTASGLITSTGTGIYNRAGIGTVTNNGTISAGVGIVNNSTINVVDNGGAISGSVAAAIANFASIGVVNNTAAGIVSGHTGLYNSGSIGTLANIGTITGTVADGFDNLGSIGGIGNNGLISGQALGLLQGTSSIATIDNSGTISGGVTGLNNIATIGQVTNSGTISGGVADGISTNGDIATLLNSGVIAGGVKGIENDLMLTTLDNMSGGTISGGSTALLNFGTIGTLSNNGTLISSASAINNSVAGTINLIDNAGLIESTNGAAINDNGAGSTIGTLVNSGGATIAGQSTGVENVNGAIGAISNSGTITGGTIALANGGSIGSLDNQTGGHLTAPGTGIANTGSIGTLTNSGIISGAGGDGIGNGTLGSIGQLTNTGTISGGVTGLDAGLASITVINSGVIRGASGPGLVFKAGQVTNAPDGLITGVTGVMITGNGATLVNSGTIIGTGGTAIAIAPGADPPEIVLSGSTALTGAINGGGTNGQVTLTGQNSIASSIVDFGSGSALTIANGADWTATGNWTLETVTNTGVFQAGVLGTPLSLTGNFAQAPGATLVVAVTPTQSSQFFISGKATITGGVSYIFAPGTYTAKSYPYLTAGSGVSGTFTSSSYAGNVPSTLAHNTTAVPVSVDINLSAGTISALTQPGIVTPEDDWLFSEQSQAQAELAQATSFTLLDAAARPHPAGACAAPPPPPDLTFGQSDSAAQAAAAAGAAICTAGGWSEAEGALSTISAAAGLPGYHTTTGGFLAGIDRAFGPGDTRLGLAAGYDTAALKDRGGGDGNTDTARAALYAAQPIGLFTLATEAGYGYAHNTTSRQTGLGVLGAAGKANILSLGGAISANFSGFGLDWLPLAGAAAARLTGAHTAETAHGASAAFAVHGDIPAMNSIIPYVSLTARRNFTTASGLMISPEVSIGYQMEVGRSGEATNIFAADGTAFSTPYDKIDTRAATAGACVTAGLGGWGMFVRYRGTDGEDWFAQMLEAGLLVRF